MSDEKKKKLERPCEGGHDAAAALYLTTHYTPHVRAPLIRSVAVHMFLCKECGHPYAVHQEIPRGYMPDGSLNDEMLRQLEETRIMGEVEQRVQLIMAAQAKRQQQDRPIQGATREGDDSDGAAAGSESAGASGEAGRGPEAGHGQS